MFVKALDTALRRFNVERQAYYGGTFIGNHVHSTLEVTRLTANIIDNRHNSDTDIHLRISLPVDGNLMVGADHICRLYIDQSTRNTFHDPVRKTKHLCLAKCHG